MDPTGASLTPAYFPEHIGVGVRACSLQLEVFSKLALDLCYLKHLSQGVDIPALMCKGLYVVIKSYALTIQAAAAFCCPLHCEARCIQALHDVGQCW